VIPANFPESNAILARDQDPYEPMYVHQFKDSEGRIAMCFRLSPVEIDEIVKTRTLWIQQLTFNRRFQPIGLSTQKPDDMAPPNQVQVNP
jgi:hypothetical protein